MAGALERTARTYAGAGEDLAAWSPPARVRPGPQLGDLSSKLGQILATRGDLSPEWIAEFGKLQDAAPPCLCRAAGTRFETWARRGRCSPSSTRSRWRRPRWPGAPGRGWRRHGGGAQRCAGGHPPGDRGRPASPLTGSPRSSKAEAPTWPATGRLRSDPPVCPFLRRELDFSAEGATPSASPAVRRHPGDRRAAHPLAMDRRGGSTCRISSTASPAARPRRCRRLRPPPAGPPGRRRRVLKMILEGGLLPADPHQGNVFYLPGNRIALHRFRDGRAGLPGAPLRSGER